MNNQIKVKKVLEKPKILEDLRSDLEKDKALIERVFPYKSEREIMEETRNEQKRKLFELTFGGKERDLQVGSEPSFRKSFTFGQKKQN